jgi:hypothetical protein
MQMICPLFRNPLFYSTVPILIYKHDYIICPIGPTSSLIFTSAPLSSKMEIRVALFPPTARWRGVLPYYNRDTEKEGGREGKRREGKRRRQN